MLVGPAEPSAFVRVVIRVLVSSLRQPVVLVEPSGSVVVVEPSGFLWTLCVEPSGNVAAGSLGAVRPFPVSLVEPSGLICVVVAEPSGRVSTLSPFGRTGVLVFSGRTGRGCPTSATTLGMLL